MVEQIEEMEKCVDEFYQLCSQDSYISKKTFEKYLDKYEELFQKFLKHDDKENNVYQKILVLSQNGYTMIDEHNQKYIKEKLKEHKDYFDHMFDGIDSNILLDEEQRKAILIDEDYSLIIAGAGSGKTTTMAAKLKYLVDIKKINPEQIILLAFTNKAANELEERINQDFKLGVSVLTFHKLGINLIRKITKEKVSIIGSSGQYELLANSVKNIVFPNKKLLQVLMKAFPNHIHFDEKCLEYENFSDYWEYYTKLKYEQYKNNLEKENTRRIKTRTKYHKTINGEYVKSEGEVKIANYLYKNGIHYIYEELFPEKLNQNRTYKPDFTIHDLGDIIYLEYYGKAKLNQNQTISSYDKDYKDGIYKKRKLHQKYNTDFIELFGQYESKTSYLPQLSYELDKHLIIRDKKSEEEIFYRLMETSQDSLFINFIHLIKTFISIFKEQNYQKEDFKNLIKKTEDPTLKKQLQIARSFYLQYEIDKKKENKFDFADMINFAYQNMEQLRNKKLNYQYIIIDEYQDISTGRYHFAKRLSDIFDSKIVAVGDDWQAIFSFSGSDVELFTKFYERMGYAEIVKISKTYRNSQELIDLASDFVSKNTEQFGKTLISDKHLHKPVELIEYKEDLENGINDLPQKLRELLLKMDSEHQKILLLGRYKKDIDPIIESKYFKKGTYDHIVLKEKPEMKIEFLTIHSAKGLGYDQVILLNAIDDTYGFPSKIEDHPLIELIRNKEQSIIDYPEERRLFYVALTRTKNKIYIMCPNQTKWQSNFIKEIMSHENVKMKES